MSGGRSHTALALALGAWAPAFFTVVVADAQPRIELDLAVGGGTDGGLFRLATDPVALGSTEDRFVLARPSASFLWTGVSQYASLRYDGYFREFELASNGSAFGHQVGVDYGARLTSWLALEASAGGALEDFTDVDSDYRALFASLGPRFEIGERVRLGVGAEAQVLDSAGVDSRFGGGVAEVAWSGETLEVGARGGTRGGTDGYRLTHAGTFAGLRAGRVTANADATLGWLEQGSWLSWGAGVRFAFADHWNVSARYRGSREAYTGAPALLAHEALLALGYHWEPGGGADPAILARAAAIEHEPARGAQIVALVKDARSVALVGDFNGWDPQGQPLVDEGAGIWRVHLTLPPGRYSYLLSVDGVLQRPRGASGYAPDGFGGENAVLIIGPGLAEEHLECCS